MEDFLKTDEGSSAVAGSEAELAEQEACAEWPGTLAGEGRRGGVADVVGYEANWDWGRHCRRRFQALLVRYSISVPVRVLDDNGGGFGLRCL